MFSLILLPLLGSSLAFMPLLNGILDQIFGLLKKTSSCFSGSWLLVGDFNAILRLEEKLGGRDFGSSSHNIFANFCSRYGSG